MYKGVVHYYTNPKSFLLKSELDVTVDVYGPAGEVFYKSHVQPPLNNSRT